MRIELPPPIVAYFVADEGTGTTVSECFTPDAVVRDEGHTYQGSSEIQNWKATVAAKYTYTCEPLQVEQQGDATVVTCRLEGSFPGSPTNLRFFFHLAEDKIASLEVIQ
tara:strand:+ start:1197 stop:1523 length:327 start_codon:yes stop_codon:yes gene_type:complete